MPDHARLHAALTEFVHTVVRDYDIGHTLDLLTDHVTQVVGVAGAGVSLADEDGHLQFVTATDETTSRVEQLQNRVRQGPCHDAHQRGEPVWSADLNAEGRWEKFVPGALEAGLMSVAGIPMTVGHHRIGALNLYHREPRGWEDDVAACQLLADMATGYILHAKRLQESQALTEQLQHALDSRVVIEQAKGMIAARQHLDLDDAFGLLRGYARRNNRKLHDAARDVIDGILNL
ncbi:MAG TPA: GAF and ANTAR domain-containing protein [Egibacteraceae bacterium]|nr:GAF and ANTAR domain-containing protein [Egibacteraceae bacterium]